ncbi:hypothetical protein JCM19237_1483 [Photobacterium aphoticum]|uniref:Uncharacterized protein n=1 Tax=Photobacterium aphoticum TaxID=754436 RepID=A0A090QZ67_9GAMM|nr:hypothetical protein JCM19237_1483 [Photobacterium aphoticum]
MFCDGETILASFFFIKRAGVKKDRQNGGYVSMKPVLLRLRRKKYPQKK